MYQCIIYEYEIQPLLGCEVIRAEYKHEQRIILFEYISLLLFAPIILFAVSFVLKLFLIPRTYVFCFLNAMSLNLNEYCNRISIGIASPRTNYVNWTLRSLSSRRVNSNYIFSELVAEVSVFPLNDRSSTNEKESEEKG